MRPGIRKRAFGTLHGIPAKAARFVLGLLPGRRRDAIRPGPRFPAEDGFGEAVGERTRTRRDSISVAAGPLPDHGILIGHATVGDTTVAFAEFLGATGKRIHWAFGVDDDGVRIAIPWTQGPLVPGRPFAGRGEILEWIRGESGSPRPDLNEVRTTASQILEASWGRVPQLNVVLAHSFEDFSTEEIATREAVGTVVGAVFERLGPIRLLTCRKLIGENPNVARALMATSAEVRSLEAFLRARPWLHTLAVTEPTLVYGRDVEEAERSIASAMGLSRATLRRMSRHVGHVSPRLAVVVAALPVDWLPDPEDEREWAAFRAIAEALGGRPMGVSLARSLLKGSKGRWAPFVDRIARECGVDGAKFIDTWQEWIPEEVEALGKLEDPFKGKWTTFREMGAVANRFRDVQDLCAEFEGTIAAIAGVDRQEAVARLAQEAIVGSRGLSSLLEASREWHRDPAFNATSLSRPEMTWDALLPEWTDPATGISVVPLASSHQLAFDGLDGEDADGMTGLAHCVGGDHYVLECLRHRIRIVSLRKEGRRLSTAEIVLGQGSTKPPAAERIERVRQHYGRRNRSPGPEEVRALRAYMDLAQVRAASANSEERSARLAARTAPGSPEEILARWRPYLTGKWKTARLDDLVAALGDGRGEPQ